MRRGDLESASEISGPDRTYCNPFRFRKIKPALFTPFSSRVPHFALLSNFLARVPT